MICAGARPIVTLVEINPRIDNHFNKNLCALDNLRQGMPG